MKLSELQQTINKLIEATGNNDPEIVFKDEHDPSFEYYFMGVGVEYTKNYDTKKGVFSPAPEAKQKLIFTVSEFHPNEKSKVQE